MGFNYAKEKTKFERQWTAIRKQCEEAGMEQEAIEDLHDFDRDWFKSQRRYITHLVDLAEHSRGHPYALRRILLSVVR